MNSDPTSLDRLHDIVVPPSAPWWPPQPGWCILGLFLLCLLAAEVVRLFARWQANCYRREALRELDRELSSASPTDSISPKNTSSPGDLGGKVTTMATLLKRAALTAYPRESVASLSGPAWLTFLDRTGQTTAFTTGPGALLEQVAYDARRAAAIEAADVKRLEVMVRLWLSHHRIEPDRGGSA